jgi:hypothetical protein
MADGMDTMKTGRGIQPVVDNPKLPPMGDEPPAPRTIRGKILRMAEEPKPDTGKQRRMSTFRKAAVVRQLKTRPEQKEANVTRAEAAQQPEGYVRLRLRVTDGEMSVVGAKAVEGPLVEPKLQGALAYEATVGEKRVAAGGIPDVGERRSFPDPEGKGVMRGHHVEELKTYEVNVRIPKEQVSAAALPRLEIALYKMKEELPEPRVDRLPAGPIGARFERELREVGRMKGIRPDKLARPVAQQVRKAFG